MQNIARVQVTLTSVSQVTLLAKRFAELLEQQATVFSQTPWIIFLDGDLGTGKTTFVRSVLQAMGEKGRIKSPTYTILESYMIKKLHILHLDLYRLVDPDELHFLGIDDYLDENTIFFIEWPKKACSMLPRPDLLLHYNFLAQGRSLELTAFSQQAVPLLESIHEVCI